jgi:hypothetical protein
MHRTARSPKHCGTAGFNLIEVALGLSLLVSAGSVSGPPVAGALHRARVEGTADEIALMLRASRALAAMRGSPVVVTVDPTWGGLVAFADLHGETAELAPDGVFNPIADRPPRLTDYEIGRFRLPGGIGFDAPGGSSGLASVDGFDNPDRLPDRRAIFLEDGSVESAGAFRLADTRGNYLEILTAPRNPVDIQVLKWDGARWVGRGPHGAPWEWR